MNGPSAASFVVQVLKVVSPVDRVLIKASVCSPVLHNQCQSAH
ncbi:hypothetical protein [Propioniciclava sp.]|nr:hypothetical protein [Propioniciclava sp.]